MVKQSKDKKHDKESKGSGKSSRKNSTEVTELLSSPLVKLKQQNQKILEKQQKEMDKAVDQNVDMKQASMAVKALQKYFKDKSKLSVSGKKMMLANEDDAFIHLNFTLTQVPEKPSPKPIQVTLPTPIQSKEHNTRVCIFVKDPEDDMRRQIEDMDIPCIAEVIGFDRLKRDFRQFKDKRALLNDFDMFLADLRIYKMLPEKLGKEFYSKKVYPCPIKLHGMDAQGLQDQLNQAAECAYFMPGNGPNYSMKIGRVSQDSKDVVKNISASLGKILGSISCWDNIKFDKVQQISLKIDDQIDLPIYNSLKREDIEAYLSQQQI